MDIFTQKKVLTRVVFFLAALNIISIGFLWYSSGLKKHEPPLFRGGDYRDVSGILKKELGLTKEQEQKIKNLRTVYFEKETELERTIRSERDSMNEEMFNKNSDEQLIKSLARRVSDNEYKMELMRFEQAQKFKSICTPQQLEKFENLVKEIRDYFRPDNQPKRKK
jgi:Spy/CpxP family protein refolding chaperone